MKEKMQDYQEYVVEHEQKHPKKKVFIGIAVLIAVLILFIVGGLIYYNINLQPVSDNTESVIINIPNGATSEDIAELLKKHDLIRNEMIFKSYAGMHTDATRQIKAGIYEFNQSMSVPEILEKMITGELYMGDSAVLIPEGKNLKEIGALLESYHICDANAFIKEASKLSYYKAMFPILSSIPDDKGRTLEGYLFPDTYCFLSDTAPEDVIKAMLERFVDVYDTAMQKATKNAGKTVDEIIIMGSIIELETKLPEDKANAASVFYNRMAAGMPLQSDITVDYALGSKHDVLTNEQTQVDSPYNTYIHTGLPLGPICSPSVASMEAAIHPAETDYYYFVADMSTGKLHFNKTNDEHLSDSAIYMQ